MPQKKRLEIQIFGNEGKIGSVSAYLDDAALVEIANLVNKHCETGALNVEDAPAQLQPPSTNE
jgi:hypothetical protein